MIRFVLFGVAVAFAAAVAPQAAAASDVEDVASPAPSASPSSPGSLVPIGRVFASDRRSEPIGQTSRPTFVVSRARIEAYGARTVADALEGVPGLDLFSTGPFGAHVDYGIRGATSAQTLVLVDGISIADPTTGAVELANFSTIGVDRIEVVESASSTLYGTSASGGVINIVTRVPRGAYLEASSGSNADRDARISLGDGRVGFSYERHVATNAYSYPTLQYSPAATFPSGVRDDSFGIQSAGRLSADVPLAAGFRLRGRADAQGAYVGAAGPLEFPSLSATQNASSNSALLELERATGASTLTLSLAGSQNRLAYTDPNGFPPGESDVFSGRSQLSLRDAIAGSRADAVVGIDFARETGNFTAASAASGATQSQAAAYAQFGTSPVSGMRVTAGLRAENDAPHGSVLAPAFGGAIKSGSMRFAGNVGESFRVPSLDELYFPGFSNPLLLPEKAQTGDFTVAYDAPQATLSLGWFDRNGSNFIVSPPPNYLPLNARRAATAGVQVTASTKPLRGLVAEASFTDLYRALDLTTGGRLAHNPVGRATLSIAHPFTNDRVAYGFRWTIVGSDGDDTAQPSIAPLTGRYDAYDSLDAYVRFKLAKDAVLSLRGFNLGGAQNAPVFGYPTPGRRFYVELATH
ncbi:MAG: TonB-dependent receptor [Candidatus Eremiobacteraeota bacterium]|nr:TonB-dependent receptor [Candidatus Eremiobacteraeota bacterium]